MGQYYVCTKEQPWKPEYGTPAGHPDAEEVGEQRDGYPGGDLIRVRCPHCGVQWEEELPQ